MTSLWSKILRIMEKQSSDAKKNENESLTLEVSSEVFKPSVTVFKSSVEDMRLRIGASNPSLPLALKEDEVAFIINLRNHGVSKEVIADLLALTPKSLGKTITNSGYFWDVSSKTYKTISEKPPAKRKAYNALRSKTNKKITLVLSKSALMALDLIVLMENKDKSKAVSELLASYGENNWPLLMTNSTINVKSKVIRLSK
jgi:hypothetical protein